MAEVRHVPPELSSFVGRAAELAAVGDLVTAGQVLTLVGPGRVREHPTAGPRPPGPGRGLARRRRLGGTGARGDGRHVVHRMAEALDLLLPAGSERERQLLIVVDNCEHVLDGAAHVISAVLSRCPRVAVLATSRVGGALPSSRVRSMPVTKVYTPPSGCTAGTWWVTTTSGRRAGPVGPSAPHHGTDVS
jgi:hypothetical protein